MHEAGGDLVTDMTAAIAKAEQRACAAIAAAAAAAAAASSNDSQLCMPAQPPPRPTLYVLVSGKDAAEVAELAVSEDPSCVFPWNNLSFGINHTYVR